MSRDLEGHATLDLISRLRSGAEAEYGDACAQMYRNTDRSDERQRDAWRDAELRAKRHERLLNMIADPEGPRLELTDDATVKEALARFARDYPQDPGQQQIKASGARSRTRRRKQNQPHSHTG